MPPLIIAALITAGAGLVTTGVNAAVESKTDCGKECRAKCKSETGWLLGGRNECKKQCKKKCAEKLSPQEKEMQLKADQEAKKKANTLYYIAGFMFLIALGIALYYVFKKK